MDALTALTQARFHDQLIPNVMSFEWAVNKSGSAAGTDVGIGTGVVPGFDNRTVAFLKERGHNVTFVPQGQSAAQAIRLLENGTFEAAGEPRQKESGGFAV